MSTIRRYLELNKTPDNEGLVEILEMMLVEIEYLQERVESLEKDKEGAQ